MPLHEASPVADDLFDLARAREARDQAIETVTEHNLSWSDRAIAAVQQIPFREITGEEVRRIIGAEVGQPAHHNAWGALIRHAVAKGYLKPTGTTRPMTSRKSHARKTPVYETSK